MDVVICSSPMQCATACLNGNAFPDRVKSEAWAAVNRLAVLLRNGTRVPGEIDKAANAFMIHLRRNWTEYLTAAQGRPDVELTAYSDGLDYLSCLHSVLYETKAFLDVYAGLLSKLLAPYGGSLTFKRAKINGCKLSGGRLANWVNNLSAQTCPCKQALFDHIVQESRQWITPLVQYRDMVAHFRDIPGFRHMRVSLSNAPGTIDHSNILLPEMPNGKLLGDYAYGLCDHVGRFVDVTIRLIPSVKVEILESWTAARKYLQT